MASLLQFYNSLFPNAQKRAGLSASQLMNFDEAGKQDALEAVDILIKYKSTVHEFTDEIIEFWALPRTRCSSFQLYLSLKAPRFCCNKS